MKKIFLFCIPQHANLGDQAQLMCTELWIKKNYPEHKLIKIPELFTPFDNSLKTRLDIKTIIKYIYLKFTIGKDDLFFGHSGYFFIDHHAGWFTYDFILNHFPKNKFVILPQTINFYTPVVKKRVTKDFNHRENLTVLCRDEVSYAYAEQLFPKTKHLLYPDIVTSLIGTRTYNNKRKGILFCMRDDIEACYTSEDIQKLSNRFGDIRKKRIDTTIKVSPKEMNIHRSTIINKMIEEFATFSVVITDRYHGTIFSAIASTPVVVIDSADHKLSSGVNWFPKEIFGRAVQFAKNLEEAYNLASNILSEEKVYNNPSFFKDNYWDKLKSKL